MQYPKTVVSSSDEAKTGGIFEIAQNGISLRHILDFFLHQKPTTGSPIITNNITYQGILTCFIKTCKSKTWGMRYHFLEDRIFQEYIY